MNIKTSKLLCAALVLFLLKGVQAAEPATFTLVVEKPEHGSLSFTPAVPMDGKVAAGTSIKVHATAEKGYALDSLFTAVKGMFGRDYTESRTADFTVVADKDKIVSALFLPVQQLSGWHEIQDVVYAKPGVKALKYDVFAPEAAKGLPMVVIIHGGGWRSNTEDIMRGMAREIVRGSRYVAVSIDYRWLSTGDGDSKGNSMADLIDDVFGALAHIQEHAVEYGGDPQSIAVTGDSAGGHLAAVTGTMVDKIGSGGFGKQKDVFEFMPSYLPKGKTAEQVRSSLTSAIRVVAPSYGIFAAASASERVGLQSGADPAVADASWDAAIAPQSHVPAAAQHKIPHYLIRGSIDPLISAKMVQDYATALKAQGQNVKQVEVDGASHAFYDWKPDQQTRDTFAKYGVPYVHDMLSFFDGVFYPGR